MASNEERLKAVLRPDDLIAAVLEDHADIKDLFEELTNATDTETREDVTRSLVTKLVVHETAEQEIVHPLTRRAPGAEPVVEGVVQEERIAERELAGLEDLEVGSPEFNAKIQELRLSVERHAEREETQELPLLERAEPEERLRRMVPAFRAAQALAPTHPHPQGPQSSTGKIVMGPFIALADRTRDVIRDAMSK